MKTLIITSSLDVTVDLLVIQLGSESFIRINYDRPLDWKIKLNYKEIYITSSISLKTFTSNDIEKCVWRKPFISEPNDHPYEDEYYKSEWKYLLYDIYFLLESKGRRVLNTPILDYQFSKHKQARSAEKYFHIEPINTSVNITLGYTKNSVAKSIAGKPFSNGNIFYTTDVSNEELDGSLWTIQKKINRTHDLTIVYVYGSIFAFELDRIYISGIDWRKEQFALVNLWKFIKLNDAFIRSIKSFMQSIDLCYGRLDFLSNKNAEEAVFLEVNRNGQWAWLDIKNDNGLLKRMTEVYNPNIKISYE